MRTLNALGERACSFAPMRAHAKRACGGATKPQAAARPKHRRAKAAMRPDMKGKLLEVVAAAARPRSN